MDKPPASDTKRLGYTCPYIPVEILASTGLQPYCLLHGDYDLMQYGTAYARIDACPLVRANIAHILTEADKYAALIGSTGCDMSRRLFDIIAEETDIPAFVINMPRTDNFQIFSDEIEWLIQKLEKTFNVSIADRIIAQIDIWQSIRDGVRELDNKRYSLPSVLPTSTFHEIVCSYYQNTPIPAMVRSNEPSTKPRVYMVGSEISYESGDFLRLIEHDLSIVGDTICGLSQFLNVWIKDRSIEGIKQAYYQQPPCIYRRPNHKFYDHILAQLKKRSCDGVIGFTLDYCDAYEFELKKMEQVLGLPVLRIRTDYAGEKVSQLRTRIAAFREMLCSKI